MQMPIWSLDFDLGDESAIEALSEHLLWNAYPLGNFAPPYRRFMRVARARSRDGRRAACVLFRHPEFAVVVPSGDPEGVGAIVESAAAALPSDAELMVLPEHVPTFERHFTVEPIEWMCRVHVDAEAFRPLGETSRVSVLAPDDLADLAALYDEGSMPFYAEQVEAGFFYGSRRDGRLVAAAGTHNLSRAQRVAALGSLYVRPEARRVGLGRELTVARVGALFASGFRNVVANVGVGNEPSLELHERLGFRRHCRFLRARIRVRPRASIDR